VTIDELSVHPIAVERGRAEDVLGISVTHVTGKYLEKMAPQAGLEPASAKATARQASNPPVKRRNKKR
jgi:hypothetical protein